MRPIWPARESGSRVRMTIRTRGVGLAVLAGASVLALASTAHAQGPELPGVCLTDQRASNDICACFGESGIFQPQQTFADGRLCRDNEERLDLPIFTGTIPECKGPDCDSCTGPDCDG